MTGNYDSKCRRNDIAYDDDRRTVIYWSKTPETQIKFAFVTSAIKSSADLANKL